jgi:hypothetical protein
MAISENVLGDSTSKGSFFKTKNSKGKKVTSKAANTGMTQKWETQAIQARLTSVHAAPKSSPSWNNVLVVSWFTIAVALASCSIGHIINEIVAKKVLRLVLVLMLVLVSVSVLLPDQAWPWAAGRRGGQKKAFTARTLDGGECSICLELVTDESNFQLPCGYWYHTQCVRDLRAHGGSESCPNCRGPLPPGQEDAFDRATRLVVRAERIDAMDKTAAAQLLGRRRFTAAGDQGGSIVV